ncbi:MAG: SDR family NAD(P)-dependent oxidoreductase, partial [Burkholderiales bacterium]
MTSESGVAIVTGAAGGIGEATAGALARKKMRVVIADLRADAAEAIAKRLESESIEAMPVQVDIADEASVNQMVKKTLDQWGRIDVLINNAGTESSKPFLEIGLQEFERVMRIN